MIELRWLVKSTVDPSVRVLQYRTPVLDIVEGLTCQSWSEWRQVPAILEECEDR